MPVINMRDVAEAKQNGVKLDYVYIGRPTADAPVSQTRSPWGNPFVWVHAHAGREIKTCGITRLTEWCPDRATSIVLFKKWVTHEIAEGNIDPAIFASLHGKTLACFCSPEPCHGDALLHFASEAAGNAVTAEDFIAAHPLADVEVPF